MELARRSGAADGKLGYFGGLSMSRQRRNGRTQGLQRNGGDAQAGVRVLGKGGVYHLGHAAFGAANEDGVRCGQVGQNLRGGPLDQGQIIGVEFLPVLADEGTGVGGTFHRVDMPARCGQRQFDADASGPGPDIPKGICRPDSQLRQCGGADFLLRHGDLSPDEGIIREAGARRAGRTVCSMSRTLRGAQAFAARACAVPNARCSCGGTEVFTYDRMGVPKAYIGQFGAEGGGRFGAAGQEEHRAAFGGQALGCRVTGTAVGRDELPILPRAANGRREKLHAGNTGQHPRRNAEGPQHGQQLGSTGIKPGVAAVKKGRICCRKLGKAGQNILRFIEGFPVLGAAGGQMLQQPFCPDDEVGALQGNKPLRREQFRWCRNPSRSV